MLQIIDRAEQLLKRLPVTAPRLNVLMFGFDSVSRLTWMRNLPRSYQYLVDRLGIFPNILHNHRRVLQAFLFLGIYWQILAVI